MKILCCILLLCVLAYSRAREVNATIIAQYQRPILSPIYGTAIFLTKEHKSLVWEFFEGLKEHTKEIDELMQGEYSIEGENRAREIALSASSPILTPNMVQVLKIALNFQFHVPTLEAHHTESEKGAMSCGTNTFVEYVNDQDELVALCSEEKVKKYLDTPREYCLENAGYVYSIPSLHYSQMGEGCGHHLVLTGVPSSSSFNSLHELITTHPKIGDISYSIKFAVVGIPSSPYSPLAGYGAFLDVKNSEYLEKREKWDEKKEENGIHFPTLLQRHGEDVEDDLVDWFEEIQVKGEAGELKSWELSELAVRSTKYIMRGYGQQDSFQAQLSRLQETTQNFPVMAGEILKEVGNSSDLTIPTPQVFNLLIMFL